MITERSSFIEVPSGTKLESHRQPQRLKPLTDGGSLARLKPGPSQNPFDFLPLFDGPNAER
jgi:hypothetical protein